MENIPNMNVVYLIIVENMKNRLIPVAKMLNTCHHYYHDLTIRFIENGVGFVQKIRKEKWLIFVVRIAKVIQDYV